MENKEKFIKTLFDNCHNFKWTDSDGEYSSEIGDYLVCLDPNIVKDEVILFVSTHNACLSFQQYKERSKNNILIRDTYLKINEILNEEIEDNFWANATSVLERYNEKENRALAD